MTYVPTLPNTRASRVRTLRDAALDTTYVSLGSRRTSSPHEFYRYPARFSPSFARAAIEAFTSVGDVVLDPFVGGGTTLVEARLAGRISLGSDLNPLAVLISKVKSRPFKRTELDEVSRWVARLPREFSTRGRIAHDEWRKTKYFRNFERKNFLACEVPSPEPATLSIQSARYQGNRSPGVSCFARDSGLLTCAMKRPTNTSFETS